MGHWIAWSDMVIAPQKAKKRLILLKNLLIFIEERDLKYKFEYICYIDSEPIRKFVDRVNLNHFIKTRPEVVVVRNRTIFEPKEKINFDLYEEAPF